MTFEIKTISIEDTTMKTQIELVLSNGSTKIVEVSHFRPETNEDVLMGLKNAEITAEKELLYPATIEAIKTDLQKIVGTKIAVTADITKIIPIK